MNSCILCKKEKPFVFTDYDLKIGRINLCYECNAFVFSDLKLLSKLLICACCQQKFIPKYEWQRECFDCYWKKKNKIIVQPLSPQKEKKSVQTILGVAV